MEKKAVLWKRHFIFGKGWTAWKPIKDVMVTAESPNGYKIKWGRRWQRTHWICKEALDVKIEFVEE